MSDQEAKLKITIEPDMKKLHEAEKALGLTPIPGMPSPAPVRPGVPGGGGGSPGIPGAPGQSGKPGLPGAPGVTIEKSKPPKAALKNLTRWINAALDSAEILAPGIATIAVEGYEEYMEGEKASFKSEVLLFALKQTKKITDEAAKIVSEFRAEIAAAMQTAGTLKEAARAYAILGGSGNLSKDDLSNVMKMGEGFHDYAKINAYMERRKSSVGRDIIIKSITEMSIDALRK